jgi:ABC-type anion transport system duplicated permease subunit
MPSPVLRRQVSLGVVVWIVVGVVVAARDGFVDDLGSLSKILSAILAVAVWPLVLLNVHFGI